MSYRFKGKLLKLVTTKRRLPNGRLAGLEIIEHPGAVLIVPYLDPNRLILLRQYRPVLKKFLFEFPAGNLNPNEKPLACAYRELIEETGYQSQGITKIGKIFPVPGYSTEVITIYKAQQLTHPDEPNAFQADADEILQPQIKTKAEIKDLFKKGRIHDAKTICALAYSGLL